MGVSAATELTRAWANGAGFVREVERLSGQKVASCYQCGKCTAGCPMAADMDVAPRQILRFLQLGLQEEALNNSTIWLCASCMTCVARCPREVDLPRIMDALRQIAVRRGRVKERRVYLFHRLFLAGVRRGGRLDELRLVLGYNLRSGQLFKDAAKAPALFLKGKIRVLPEKTSGAAEVQQIFARWEARKP
ncbi:MAG: 4Fe-4S dicluster domain-containing protein [Firmicutes bacterium]|nr:4Fe-4S dicluster domain-containing protein [Bacillota bacterium]